MFWFLSQNQTMTLCKERDIVASRLISFCILELWICFTTQLLDNKIIFGLRIVQPSEKVWNYHLFMTELRCTLGILNQDL